MIPQYLSRRYVAFTPQDDSDWCDLLVARFPNVRFVPRLSYDEQHSADPPPMRVLRHIRETDAEHINFYFTPPEWRFKYRWLARPERSFWTEDVNAIVWPNGYWWRSGMQDRAAKFGSPQPACIGRGEIVFRARAEFPEDRKTVQAALRLIKKVASNKLAEVRVDDPAWPAWMQPPGKGFDLWAGHHAMEWARQSPGRVLGPIQNPRSQNWWCGYRPIDAVPPETLKAG
jgi:hypothetical protein